MEICGGLDFLSDCFGIEKSFKNSFKFSPLFFVLFNWSIIALLSCISFCSITNPLYVYIYFLPLGLPSLLSTSISPIQVITKHQAELPVQVPASYLFYTWQCIYWRRKQPPTPVFLPGKSHRQEPGGLQSMGSQRVEHD